MIRNALLLAVFGLILGTEFSAMAAIARPPLFPDLAFRLRVGDAAAANPLDETEGPKTLATADLNGDGIPDVVVGNLDGSVSVLLGDKTNGLLPQILTPATGILRNSSLRAIVTADFNADSKLDVAVGDIAGEGVVVLLGSGDGKLVPSHRTALGPTRAMAAADFDEDGKTDLLVACSPPECTWCVSDTNSTNRFLALLPGNGDGSFAAPIYLLSPGIEACFYDVEAGDIDNDGKPDAIALDYSACISPTGIVTRQRRIQIFKNNGAGGFHVNQPDRILEGLGEGPRALRLAYLDEILTGGNPPPDPLLDIVMVNRDSASLDIFLNQGGLNFSPPVSYLAGDTPRDVGAGDLNGDGWNELIVVNRNKNTLSVLPGLGGGKFGTAAGEFPTGVSPRQIVLADFNQDGSIDAAVNNRLSEDISLFHGQPGINGFLMPGSYYWSGLSPVSLVAEDFNNDGWPDTAVVAMRSHDLRVRLNLGNGKLGQETLYPIDFLPAFVASGDLNGDGRVDLVVTSLRSQLGADTTQHGSLVALLGRGDGTFLSPLASPLGADFREPYWLRLGDLDNDTILDAVVSGLNGQLMAFHGSGNGTFAAPVKLGNLPRGRPLGFALGDFDHNGRLDLAGSDGSILLNDGQFFSPDSFLNGQWKGRIKRFDAGTQAWAVETDDLDGDGHLDLMVALTFVQPDPIGITFGRGDGTFTESTIYEGPDVGVVGMAAADVDQDGIKDIVIGNRCAATVIIMRGLGDRRFEYEQIIETYAAEDVAVADVNRDQKPDIIGVGLGLWVLLNGSTNELVAPKEIIHNPLPLRLGLYINEIMASNREFHITNGITPDWVEIYNNSITSINLAGWSFSQRTADGEINKWTFPVNNSYTLPRGQYLTVYFSKNPSLIPGSHPDFELSAEGENLTLLNPNGVVEDSIAFPALPTDVSWSRYTDGARFWGYNSAPTFGSRNKPPANLDPTAERKDPFVSPGATTLGINARFFDDVGIAYAAVCFRLEGQTQFDEITFSDDGLSGDKLAGDGYYGAILPSLPPGQTLEYYLRVIDLEGESGSSPKDPSIAANLHRIPIPYPHPALRLTEILAANKNGMVDEKNQHEDWVELFNASAKPVSLNNLVLTRDYFDEGGAWNFPEDHVIAPGSRLIIFCDDDKRDGPFHTPFKLQRSGDRIFLIQSTNWTIIDSLSFGPLPEDGSYGVLGAGVEGQLLAWPTPGKENISLPKIRQTAEAGPQLFARIAPLSPSGPSFFSLRWFGSSGANYQIQTSGDMNLWDPWAANILDLGEGLFEAIGTPTPQHQFFRLSTLP